MTVYCSKGRSASYLYFKVYNKSQTQVKSLGFNGDNYEARFREALQLLVALRGEKIEKVELPPYTTVLRRFGLKRDKQWLSKLTKK